MADELELLRGLRAEDAEPDPAAHARVRAALLERIGDEGDRAPSQQRPERPRRRRRRRWALVLASVAAAAAAIGLVSGVDEGSVDPDVAAALERAASAAEVRALDLRPGEALYVRERHTTLITVAEPARYSYLHRPLVVDRWFDRAGGQKSVTVTRRAGRVRWPSRRARARWIAAGRPRLDNPALGGPVADDRVDGFTAGSKTITYDELAALPSEGEEMYDRLIELAGDAGPTPDVEAFVIIGDLLRSAPVPADVRAGLYRAAAHIDGVTLVGRVRDPLGRPGLAVQLDHEGERRQLVFDPDTSALLAERSTLTERDPYLDTEPGFPLTYRVVERQAVVRRIGQRPR